MSAIVFPTAAENDVEIEVIKDIEYLGQGRKLTLDLYLPPDSSKPRPSVLIVHGGGWHGGDKAAKREINIGTNLAKAGYVCASVNYVLAEKKDSFVDNLRQVWPHNLQDCMKAVQFLRANAEKYQIDLENIGAIGGSAGGHLVAMLAYASDYDGLDPKDGPHADQSCRIQAVAPMYGVYDLLLLAKEREMLEDLSEEDKVLCHAASPVSYLDGDDPPALLLHGTRDALVPVSQSEALHTALEEQGLPTQLHIVDGGKHSFHLQPPQEDLRPLVIGFFDQHLK
ncbi:MAG: alpha/beta hydrolase [Verrucomicrobiota bacterium]